MKIQMGSPAVNGRSPKIFISSDKEKEETALFAIFIAFLIAALAIGGWVTVVIWRAGNPLLAIAIACLVLALVGIKVYQGMKDG